MKTLLVLLLLTVPAHACTGFLKFEYTRGMTKLCIYDHLGSDYAITVKAVELCPLTVEVGH